jgi:hypothetical protein
VTALSLAAQAWPASSETEIARPCSVARREDKIAFNTNSGPLISAVPDGLWTKYFELQPGLGRGARLAFEPAHPSCVRRGYGRRRGLSKSSMVHPKARWPTIVPRRS